MEESSIQEFGKKIDELNFNEASMLVEGIILATTQWGSGKVSCDGRVVVDSEADGKEAFAGYGRQAVRKLTSLTGDERKLTLNVTRNETRWDAIRRRKPKVKHTFHFQNEPFGTPST